MFEQPGSGSEKEQQFNSINLISSLPPYGAEHTTERGFNLSVALQTTHLSSSPTLFEQRCGFFYVSQEPDK